MIPKPQKAVEPESDDYQEKLLLGVKRIHDLSPLEVDLKYSVYNMLREKLRRDEREIDLKRMVQHYQVGMGKPLTEFMCRRLINCFEYDHTNYLFFVLKNGDEEWKSSDEFRYTQVQEIKESRASNGVHWNCH